jgi:hypothetical protein
MVSRQAFIVQLIGYLGQAFDEVDKRIGRIFF